MDFYARPASTSWEAVFPAPTHPQLVIWLWFQPNQAPRDLVVRIPEETVQAYGTLTPRQVCALIGISLPLVQLWTSSTGVIETHGGAHPGLDQPLIPVAPWSEYGLRMWPIQTGFASLPLPGYAASEWNQGATPPSHSVLSGDSLALTMAIKADWTSIETAETQLGALRKQLATVQGRLTTLNRDLNSDENIAADNQDKREWQDARRWLREGAALASRYIKEADTGVTSMAGNRRRLEQLFAEAAAGRLSGAALAAAHNEIEAHRKTVQNIQNQMQNTLQAATRDGEQRASMVLSRIAAKVRNHRTKR